MATRILMGTGSVAQMGSEVRASGGQRVLVVTDPGIKAAGLLTPVLASLETAQLDAFVFDAVKPDPDIAVVEAAFQMFVAQEADHIVAVGGGSSIDTAKAVAVLGTNGGRITDYEGRERFSNPTVPLVVVPTTVGTGSEVTRGAVVTDPARRRKMVIAGRFMAPRLAILDPELVCSLPPQVVASTGMDALTHAVEAYVSRLANPITDALALKAITMIGQHLRPAVACPANREATGGMLLASTIAGMAFGNALLGITHSMAHPVGVYYHVPHGLANAILLPHVMEFNWPANPRKFADIAVALGVPSRHRSVNDLAVESIEAVRALARDVGIPPRLADVGVDERHLEAMVQDAAADFYCQTNPRAVTADQIRRILRAAIGTDGRSPA